MKNISLKKNNITITVGSQTFELTESEAKELRDILNREFPTRNSIEDLLEKYRDKFPTNPYNPPYKYPDYPQWPKMPYDKNLPIVTFKVICKINKDQQARVVSDF